VDLGTAQRVCNRVSEGLADAAGASHRFQFVLTVVNYPDNASSAHELLQAVSTLAFVEDALRGMPEVVQQ
jgi:hypothetical protein